MRHSRSIIAPTLIALAGLALTAGVASPSGAAGGPTGSALTLQSRVALSGYDVATDKNGTTYVGWIGDDLDVPGLRQVYLCVLKSGAKSCAGGLQTASALGDSSAQNLHVVITGGQAELVWIAQPGPSSGEFSGVFGRATVSGDNLGSSVSVPGAPTLGSLTSVIPGPGGSVRAAAIGSGVSFDDHVYYYDGLGSTPKSFNRPYFVGNAQVADNGRQTVLTTSQYGSISGKVAVASKSSAGTSWSGFSNVSRSMTVGNKERLQKVGKQIRLVSNSDKALYPAYVWKWKGKARSFGKPSPTGDKNDVSTIDATTDGSGRLATVNSEVKGLAVSNFGTGTHGARFLIKVRQTYAGGPAQIATRPSGRGWVVYSVEKDGSPGQILRAQAIKLSAVMKKVHASSSAGRVTLKGPRSCMPVSTTHVAVKGKAAHAWRVASKKLRLGKAKQGGTLNGAALAPNHSYKLKGTVVFAKGGARKSVSATLSFKTCGRP